MRLFSKVSAYLTVCGPIGALLLAGCGKAESPPAPTPAITAPATIADAPTAEPAVPLVAAESPKGAEPAVVPMPTAIAPTECTHPAVVVGTRTGEKLTDVKDLQGVVRHLDGFEADSVESAIARLDYHGAKATADSVVVGYPSDGVYRVYLKLSAEAGGDFVYFDKFSECYADSIDSEGGVTGAGRYAVLKKTENYYERVPFCEEGDEDGDDCATASADAGDSISYSVFDRATGVHLFSADDSRDQDAECKPSMAGPTSRDGAFSFTDCAGIVDSFTLTDITPCTLEARDARFAKEREEEERAAKVLAAEGGGSPTLSEAELKEALNIGRKLTREKDYDAAIAAFTKIIEQDASAVTARSGRGYAYLMRAGGGDLDAAESDLGVAFEAVKGTAAADRKLKGQIAYNRGLAAKGKGEAARAKVLFELAKTLKGEGAEAP